MPYIQYTTKVTIVMQTPDNKWDHRLMSGIICPYIWVKLIKYLGQKNRGSCTKSPDYIWNSQHCMYKYLIWKFRTKTKIKSAPISKSLSYVRMLSLDKINAQFKSTMWNSVAQFWNAVLLIWICQRFTCPPQCSFWIWRTFMSTWH